MSLLQHSLRAMPTGTFIQLGMDKANSEMNAQIDAQRKSEVVRAKEIQREKGCSWGEAIRLACAEIV